MFLSIGLRRKPADDGDAEAPVSPEPAPRPAWVRRAGPVLAVAAVAAAAAVATLGLVSRTEGDVGPGRVEIRARAQLDGRTVIELPPLGAISAASHDAPVGLEALVVRLDVEEVQGLLSTPSPTDALRTEVEHDIDDLAQRFALRTVAAAAAVGALAAALLPHRRRWWHLLVGAAAGAGTVALLLGAAWRDYDTEAFLEPRFDGPLEHAPELVTTVRRHIDDLGAIRDRVEVLGEQVSRLYATASEGSGPLGTGEVRIVHVSDVHSNPLGVEITRQLVARFEADAVLDTGDITSFGLPVEGRIGDLLAGIPVPYLLVPGNHDSPTNREALADVPNVTVLDGDTVTVRGVRILGVGDPTFTADNRVSTAEANETKLQHAHVVTALVRRARPDVLAVHDVRSAIRSLGRVPLVLAGHTHARSESEEDGTTVLNVGSTGATGLGSFAVETAEPYEAQVLRFVDGRLVAYDYVTFQGIGGNFTIERRLVDPSETIPPPPTETGPR